jgi:hypothetical protein
MVLELLSTMVCGVGIVGSNVNNLFSSLVYYYLHLYDGFFFFFCWLVLTHLNYHAWVKNKFNFADRSIELFQFLHKLIEVSKTGTCVICLCIHGSWVSLIIPLYKSLYFLKIQLIFGSNSRNIFFEAITFVFQNFNLSF